MSADHPPDSRPNFGRPALENLEDAHDVLIAELRDGFADLDAVIHWHRRLAVRTLGCLDGGFYADLRTEGKVWAALITSGEREKFLTSADAISEESALETRLDYEATFVLPATEMAFRSLRKSAAEYFGEDRDETVTVAGEEFHAMRPALSHLEERQEAMLDDLLDGVDGGRSGLLDWLRDLNGATFGQIHPRFQSQAYKESDVLRRVLLDEYHDDAAAKRTRQRLAFAYLLPAFNAGVRTLVGKAGEDTGIDEQLGATMESLKA
ncbi:hypothetical protein [Haloplanus salilacus]|uniref:hypothetical protein n=1 Tax=Haloplanus salilacus TaxID=2949994 RepID=UPI0030CD8033